MAKLYEGLEVESSNPGCPSSFNTHLLIVKLMCTTDFDDPHFLEPAPSYDRKHVSDVTFRTDVSNCARGRILGSRVHFHRFLGLCSAPRPDASALDHLIHGEGRGRDGLPSPSCEYGSRLSHVLHVPVYWDPPGRDEVIVRRIPNRVEGAH